MQWCADPNAGFTAGDPWLPLAEDFATVNVAAQRDHAGSMLSLYCRLIQLRRGEPALEVGRIEPVEAEGDLLAYVRRARSGEDEFLVALNLGPREQVLRLPPQAAHGVVALSTRLDRGGETIDVELYLRPDEGLIVRLG